MMSLTKRQSDALFAIHDAMHSTGICPSFEEVGSMMGLRSKSGVHRIVSALEERGYIRRLPGRARAIEILKLPNTPREPKPQVQPTTVIKYGGTVGPEARFYEIRIRHVEVPFTIDAASHVAFTVLGDAMIDAGIFHDDLVVVDFRSAARSRDIVVAVIDWHDAVLRRYRSIGDSIALEPANPAYKTGIFGCGRVEIIGRVVGTVRKYQTVSP